MSLNELALRPTPPEAATRSYLYHLTGAEPRLRSRDSDGPTLYAIDIRGVGPNPVLDPKDIAGLGVASLVGPVLDSSGLAEWPVATRSRALGLLREGEEHAGKVFVLISVQIEGCAHCVVVEPQRRRARPYRLPRQERSQQA